MNVGRDILLVEDNRDDEMLTLRALKKNNIVNNVVVTRDGVEALDYLFARGKYKDRDSKITPQLVLLDLKLPKMDGFEVLRNIRANEITKYLPVVILTTSSEYQDVSSCYDDGANSYIHKSVDFNQFMESVKQLGLYWLVMNVTPSAIGEKNTANVLEEA